ncbi:MAG: hypothetical protein NZ821_06845 [Gloeomargarita sp. SKYB31]|nr:hypothetical protein [Gloeomargarita sp. SKYB31]
MWIDDDPYAAEYVDYPDYPDFPDEPPKSGNDPAKDAVLYAETALAHCDNGHYEKAKVMATVALVYAILALKK